MNYFCWQDYGPEHAALVDSWLDEEALRATRLDDGFDDFYQYWKQETDPERGEYFRCQLVSEGQRPFAAVAFSRFQQTVTVMEIVVDPALRGQGKGAAIIRELVANATAWFGQPVAVLEAVIFPDSTASQNAFYKAGFVPVSDEKDNDRWRRAADDPEILFRYASEKTPAAPAFPIRWLEPEERTLFNGHLRLCRQKSLSRKQWDGIVQADTRYCGLFIDGKMVARAGIEKLTDRYWEISDVRVAKEYRNRGYATAISGFVADEILKNGRVPTVRTRQDNDAMRKVIQKLGFQPFSEYKNNA